MAFRSIDVLIPRLQALKAKGFHPKVIYDIGAYKGTWTDAVQKDVFHDASFYQFEANQEHSDALSKHPYHIDVLGDTEKVVPFYSKRAGTGDSVMIEQSSFFEEDVDVKMLQMRTLDKVVQQRGWPMPDFIKSDLQGNDLKMLEGAQQAIRSAEFIVIETKVLEYNKGAPTMLEVVQQMDGYGFRPYDITELHYLPSDDLNEVDILFARKTSPFIKRGLLF